MLSTTLFLLLLLTLAVGIWGYARRGYAGLRPAGLLLLLASILWLTGQLGPR